MGAIIRAFDSNGVHVGLPRPRPSQMATERSPSSGVWSSFHSSLAQAVRGPGTPLRQLAAGLEPAEEEMGRAVDMKSQFTELDLLIE